MATRVTPAEFELMHKLYDEYGTYAEVARKIGRDAGTVSKYIKMETCPNVVRTSTKKLIRAKN